MKKSATIIFLITILNSCQHRINKNDDNLLNENSTNGKRYVVGDSLYNTVIEFKENSIGDIKSLMIYENEILKISYTFGKGNKPLNYENHFNGTFQEFYQNGNIKVIKRNNDGNFNEKISFDPNGKIIDSISNYLEVVKVSNDSIRILYHCLDCDSIQYQFIKDGNEVLHFNAPILTQKKDFTIRTYIQDDVDYFVTAQCLERSQNVLFTKYSDIEKFKFKNGNKTKFK